MINKQPHINIIFNRRRTASLTRQATVEVRVTHGYIQRYFSTGISLYSNQWKKGKIVNCPDIHQISEILTKIVSDIRSVIIDMMKEGNIDISLIPERLKILKTGGITFIEFCNQRAEIRKYGKTYDSQERYNRFMRLFQRWGKIISFEDVTEQNIISYDTYLKSTGMRPYSKWNNYHRFLNSFILDAIDAGYLRKNPYKWVNIEKDKSYSGIGKYLTPAELKRLRDSTLPSQCLERVRDLFIFQTYTCFSYTDLASFDSKLIKEVNGMKVYMGKRKKTNKTFTIPLMKPALDVLYKYNKVLPIISNVKYNQYLKLVAQAAGINKPISSHWARHTGATMLLNEGVDLKIVSKICGHSSTRITEQVYAKLLDETVVDAIGSIRNNI